MSLSDRFRYWVCVHVVSHFTFCVTSGWVLMQTNKLYQLLQYHFGCWTLNISMCLLQERVVAEEKIKRLAAQYRDNEARRHSDFFTWITCLFSLLIKVFYYLVGNEIVCCESVILFGLCYLSFCILCCCRGGRIKHKCIYMVFLSSVHYKFYDDDDAVGNYWFVKFF